MSLKEFQNYNYRQSQVSLLPHQIQVILSYTYAKKTWSPLNKTQQVLTAMIATWNWINNPTEENAQHAHNAAVAIYAVYVAYVDHNYSVVANAAYATANTSHTVGYVASSAFHAFNAVISWEYLYQTFLHAKGPNFPFQNNWKTTDTISLAKTIWDDQDLSLMRILADALQDAGMQDETLLKHLQKDECELSDWTLTNLLGFWA